MIPTLNDLKEAQTRLPDPAVAALAQRWEYYVAFPPITLPTSPHPYAPPSEQEVRIITVRLRTYRFGPLIEYRWVYSGDVLLDPLPVPLPLSFP